MTWFINKLQKNSEHNVMTMSIKLFKHNQTAYTTANDMLDKVGKAAVIHPTGTGP